MRMYPGVSMITLGVGDVERSSRFYERFGWRRAGVSNESISFFALNNIVLALFARSALAADCCLSADETMSGAPPFSGVTLAQNYGSELAVESAYDEALRAGATSLVKPAQTPWGGFHAIIADPDAHVWELAFNPFFELGADGTLTLPS